MTSAFEHKYISPFAPSLVPVKTRGGGSYFLTCAKMITAKSLENPPLHLTIHHLLFSPPVNMTSPRPLPLGSMTRFHPADPQANHSSVVQKQPMCRFSAIETLWVKIVYIVMS